MAEKKAIPSFLFHPIDKEKRLRELLRESKERDLKRALTKKERERRKILYQLLDSQINQEDRWIKTFLELESPAPKQDREVMARWRDRSGKIQINDTEPPFVVHKDSPVAKVLRDPFWNFNDSKNRDIGNQPFSDEFLRKQDIYLEEHVPEKVYSIIDYYTKTPNLIDLFTTIQQKNTNLDWTLQVKKAQHQVAQVNQAILNAPQTEQSVTLFRGSTSMFPFLPGPRFCTMGDCLAVPRGSIAKLPVWLSFDNNLTLALFGRDYSNQTYWSKEKHCCLWRVTVPSHFPLLVIEGRNHVLLPQGTSSVLVISEPSVINIH